MSIAQDIAFLEEKRAERLREAAELREDADRLDREAAGFASAIQAVRRGQESDKLITALQGQVSAVRCNIGPHERKALGALRDRASNGVAEISVRDLVRATSTSDHAMTQALRVLERMQFIDRIRPAQGCNPARYRLLKSGFGEGRGAT